MITQELKARILAAVNENREFYPSDAKHAAALGISTAVYSILKSGKTSKLLSDSNWISMARKLSVALGNEIQWKAAKTPTFEFITEQLSVCQDSSISAILCDLPNIGKTYTAKIYAQSHKNAVYVDCSQLKTKHRLIRFIAREFGVSDKGKYHEVYDDLVYYLKGIEKPLIILDEGGDLEYAAFLELKALWNATDRCCAWYMMGADGLRKKINRAINCEKVGYAEMFSRYGNRYSKVTPDDGKEREKFLFAQAGIVAKVNAPQGSDIAKIVRNSQGGLRRVYTEIEKLKRED